MKPRRFSSHNGKRGVSEVLGALLLMLVVVVAVGAFAFYLSNLQTQAEQRNSFLTNVKNDNLKVQALSFYPNNYLTQYQFTVTAGTPAVMYLFYVTEIVGSSNTVMITNGTDTTSTLDYASLPFTTPSETASLGSATWSSFAPTSSGPATGCITFSSPPPAIIAFGSCSPSAGTYQVAFTDAAISYVNLEVLNDNTQQSGLANVEVNERWVGNIMSQGQIFNMSAPLPLLARNTVPVQVNVNALNIFPNESIAIVLASTAGNYFTTVYEQPSAIITENTYTFNAGTSGLLDVPIFSATQSVVGANASIQNYYWSISQSPAECSTPPCVVGPIPGASFEFLGNNAYYGTIDGQFPFTVTLTIQDTNGLISVNTYNFQGDCQIPTSLTPGLDCPT